MKSMVRIATRKSPLALWQANYVKAELEKNYPGLQVELLPMSTRGDKILDSPLAKGGGKGLFVKELEEALLRNEADLAVHSMKDVPVEFPDGLCLATICQREDPRDAFVSNHFASIEALPQAARVGTSSLRRQCQLRARRPDLQVLGLRGNVWPPPVSIGWGWKHASQPCSNAAKACPPMARAQSALSVAAMIPNY